MRTSLAALALSASFLVAACTTAQPPTAPREPASPVGSAVVSAVRHATMYRSPACTCCHEYEAILETAGWTVEVVNVDDTAAWKTDHEIPSDAWSCHTTVVDGYLVEGHVPLAAIDRLLARGPAIDGIALPGMPAGSPGMGGVADGPLEVLAIQAGELGPFGAF